MLMKMCVKNLPRLEQFTCELAKIPTNRGDSVSRDPSRCDLRERGPSAPNARRPGRKHTEKIELGKVLLKGE